MSILNQRGQNKPVNIREVAAKRGERIGVSANGNTQFVKQSATKLYELTVSCLVGRDMASGKTSEAMIKQLRTEVAAVVIDRQFDFIANLAIHARREMNIRTMPLILVVEFAKALADKRLAVSARNKAKKPGVETSATEWNYPQMRALVCDVIQRADQITDLYAYALSVFGEKGKIPMAVKRGVADAFNKFSEYQFAKYNRDNSVKLRDVLRIVHPTATTAAQGEVFQKIMQDSLETPYTWETQLSQNGQLSVTERKTPAALWTELVGSGQLGYMAMLRNLRNIIQAGVSDEVIKQVADRLADPEQVKRSKQLPFDFLEAYDIVKPLNGRLATAVSKAMDASCVNVPLVGERVWLIIDYSGSMGGESDYGNTKSAFGTAVLLAAMLIKANEYAGQLAITVFGSNAKTLKGLDTNASIVTIKDALKAERKGGIAGSTNFSAALAESSKIGFTPDTVIVLSDGDVNSFPYSSMNKFMPNAIKMVVNLSASDTTPFSERDGWHPVSGWSPAMFKWVPAMRERQSVVEQLSQPYERLPIVTPKASTKQ